ncbi:hypothetical protein PRZ48_012192 [Zasmidium cellare]|uniref:Uncharacterized protein n=1 Tax=Zasmidium cellare TaxID=395010 RepID=A0ABR0E455_ZASCE|nr:hypothetical protein PRZ48_012192 [Zasmidium cellare]
MAAPCPFFDKLPVELRDEIYKLTFTPDHDEGKEVSLVDAAPPSKAVLMTCKQAHAEAAKLYKAMYQDYWRKTTFQITPDRRLRNDPSVPAIVDYVAPHHTADIEHIQHIFVRLVLDERELEMNLVDRRGLWECPVLSLDLEKTTKNGSVFMTYLRNIGELNETLAKREVFPSLWEQLELLCWLARQEPGASGR